MDQLKVYEPQDGPYGLMPSGGGSLVEECECYLKSEADTYIDKLKDRIQMHDFFWEGNGFNKLGFKNTIQVRNYIDDLKSELDYQKYKRCIGLAEICKSKIEAIVARVTKTHTYPYFQTCPAECQPGYNFLKRWEAKWRKLAEQFKSKKLKS